MTISAWARPARASSVSRPGSPGPAPASQTCPGAKTGIPVRRAAKESHAVIVDSPGSLVVTGCNHRTKGKGMAKQQRALRRGWTTGTCAAAAAKAAFVALVTGEFRDPVEVTLPRGERPSFALAMTRMDDDAATAGVIKDAGDDPDVTHGALICATVRLGAPGSGVILRAGEGVGTVTRPGLPVPPGEPAINPVPRRMIADAMAEVAAVAGRAADAAVEISIPGGEALAAK